MAIEKNIYHVTVEQMRLIEWARSWNWAVKFEENVLTMEERALDLAQEVERQAQIEKEKEKDPNFTVVEASRTPDMPIPYDFERWFPATDITYGLSSIESQFVNSPFTVSSIPYMTGYHTIEMTIVDGSNPQYRPNRMPIHTWLSNWCNEITHFYSGTKTLTRACKPLSIFHYDPKDNLIGHRKYAVFPSGGISFQGNSDSGVSTVSVNFIIAGTIDLSKEYEDLGHLSNNYKYFWQNP